MKKRLKTFTTTFLLALMTIAFSYMSCKKAVLEKNQENAQIAEAGWGDINALLNDLENGNITIEEFLNQLEAIMADLEGGIESLPNGLRNLPDQALLGMINSNKSEAFKVSMLLLQEHLSLEVEIAARDAGLRKTLLSQQVLPNTQPINTVGITVTSTNMLHFHTREAFETTMESLVNHVEADIDAWESSIGFLSMRRNFQQLKEDPAADHMAIDATRIPDIWFESVVNPSSRFQIADTVYQYDFPNDLLTKIFPDGTSLSIDLDNEILGSCKNNRICNSRENPYIGTQTLIFIGEKWNRYYAAWKSMGAKTKCYRDAPNSVPKEFEMTLVHFLIDQWHQVRWKQCAVTEPYNNETSYWYFEPNVWQASYAIDKKAFPAKRFDVPEFGRVHHWGDEVHFLQYWNNDCHTDPWTGGPSGC